ncbi:MAG TPA: hypothetical protein VJC01_03590 [Candidatus Paceibacterota bacterium]
MFLLFNYTHQENKIKGIDNPVKKVYCYESERKVSQLLVDARVALRSLRKDSIHERIHEATP